MGQTLLSPPMFHCHLRAEKNSQSDTLTWKYNMITCVNVANEKQRYKATVFEWRQDRNSYYKTSLVKRVRSQPTTYNVTKRTWYNDSEITKGFESHRVVNFCHCFSPDSSL